MFASSPFAGLLHHASLWLQAYALVLATMAAGAMLERRWPAALLRPLAARRWNRDFQGAVDGLIRRAGSERVDG